MESKSLNTIQTFAKIGYVLSKIAKIVSIVGTSLCAVGIWTVALGAPDAFKIGGATIHSIIERNADVSVNSIYIILTADAIMCCGEIVLAKLAENYFKNEISDGDPFTFRGANELKWLGIYGICIPIGTKIISEIVCAVMDKVLHVNAKNEFEIEVYIGIGVAMLIMSVVFRYGAELKEKKSAAQFLGEVEDYE